VIENVTGETYERAIRRLILQPLGVRESFFFPNEIMTRRFVVGHKPSSDDSLRVARPWALPRNGRWHRHQRRRSPRVGQIPFG